MGQRLMKPLRQRDLQRALRHLKAFLVDMFDREAGWWLANNTDAVRSLLADRLDHVMTPSERLRVYSHLFGFFREIAKEVLEARLRKEEAPECIAELKRLAETHKEELAKPYEPPTDEMMIAMDEELLKSKSDLLRCVGAMGLWFETGDWEKITPVLTAILRDKNSRAREDAANLLGQVRPLEPQAVQTLRGMVGDENDPVRFAAQKALAAWEQRWKF